MKNYFLLAAVAAAAHIASGQIVSVGALGGVPITDATGYSDQSRPYKVGGSVEVKLPASFALEADALYRRVGDTNFFAYATGVPSGASTDRQRGNAWEFPLLGKYYFRRSAAWQPFVATGFAFRTIGVNDSATLVSSSAPGISQTSFIQSSFREPLEVGAPVVAGIRFHYRRLAILPQVRYTRWSGTSGLVRSNEVSFLLGITY